MKNAQPVPPEGSRAIRQTLSNARAGSTRRRLRAYPPVRTHPCGFAVESYARRVDTKDDGEGS